MGNAEFTIENEISEGNQGVFGIMRNDVFMSYGLRIRRKAKAIVNAQGQYFYSLPDLKTCVFCSMRLSCKKISELDGPYFSASMNQARKETWEELTRMIYYCKDWQPLPEFECSKAERKELGILTDRDKKSGFFNSMEWKRLRATVLEQQGAACQCCGRTHKDYNVILHVDHIVPISKDWERRLDITNLQVLCEDCNIGKGNRFQTDWRKTQGVKHD